MPGTEASSSFQVLLRSMLRQSLTMIANERRTATRATSGVAVFMPIDVMANSGMAIRALPKPKTARTSVETKMMAITETVRGSMCIRDP